MGICHGKQVGSLEIQSQDPAIPNDVQGSENSDTKKGLNIPFYSPSPLRSLFKSLFPPPSPAKHFKAFLAPRHDSVKPNQPTIPEYKLFGSDRNFGYSKLLHSKYKLGEEVGRGQVGYTCSAKVKKGEMKGQEVAIKVIPKAKMTTAIAIEDTRREVTILRALTGHKNLVQFYDAYEDEENVYIVMELCKGGELLDRILARGGIYSEEDAKSIMVQILNVVAFFHLQGVVHRNLKPENFLFSSKEEESLLKAIDFGFSDFVKPDERLNAMVGSAYYIAPEVLHRSYGTEADMWSIGVIAYILLCGRRPFWDHTESGIFRAVLMADPSFDDAPWPSLSADARDFVKGLLNKDFRKRLTAAQALSHPWLSSNQIKKIPLDIEVYKFVKAYVCSSSLRKSALGALAKTLTAVQLVYFHEQFTLLGPNKSGYIAMQNFLTALLKNSTDVVKDSRVLDYVIMVSSLQYRKLDFEEFCAAAISVHKLEGMESWEQHAHRAYELFEKDGNRLIMIDELASELGLSPSVPVRIVLRDLLRHSDGKLSFVGFIGLLPGSKTRVTTPKEQIRGTEEMESCLSEVFIAEIQAQCTRANNGIKADIYKAIPEMVNPLCLRTIAPLSVKNHLNHQRKKYSLAREVINASGFGIEWDAENKYLTADQEVWNGNCKDQMLKGMLHNSFKLYDTMYQVFGDNTASGNLGYADGDSVDAAPSVGETPNDLAEDEDVRASVNSQPTPSKEGKRRREHGNSSKYSADTFDRMASAIEDLSSSLKERNCQAKAVAKKGVEFEVALVELTSLGLEQRYRHKVTTLLASNPGYERAFMFTPRESRVEYVMSLL